MLTVPLITVKEDIRFYERFHLCVGSVRRILRLEPTLTAKTEASLTKKILFPLTNLSQQSEIVQKGSCQLVS
jgi:hypothetical protein